MALYYTHISILLCTIFEDGTNNEISLCSDCTYKYSVYFQALVLLTIKRKDDSLVVRLISLNNK